MRNKFCTFALTSLLTVGLAGSAALAQDTGAAPPPQQGSAMQGHRGMNPDQQLKHMTKQLDLTADQQAQIKPILDSRQQQMQQLWQDQSMSSADRHQKMKSIQDDSSNQIQAVLNDTQKQKYQAMQEQMKQRRMQGNQAPPQDATPPAPQQ